MSAPRGNRGPSVPLGVCLLASHALCATVYSVPLDVCLVASHALCATVYPLPAYLPPCVTLFDGSLPIPSTLYNYRSYKVDTCLSIMTCSPKLVSASSPQQNNFLNSIRHLRPPRNGPSLISSLELHPSCCRNHLRSPCNHT